MVASLNASQAFRWLMIAVLCGVVIYTDARRQKIYNRTTVPVMLLGIVAFTLEKGAAGALESLKGLLGGGLILLVPFALHLVKGGDVKFLAALGAAGGIEVAAGAALYGSVLQGVAAVPLLLHRGLLRRALCNIAWYLHDLLVLRTTDDLEQVTVGRLPYGVALSLGAVTTLTFYALWRSHFPFMLP